jgi:hypothetical protein
MPADVRIKIEHYERVLPAMEYEVFLIVLGFASDAAEDALVRLRINPRRDIPGTPGTPQSVQSKHLDLFAA